MSGATALTLACDDRPATASSTKYNLDASRTAVVFAIEHIGISKTYGRFNDVSGHLHLDMSKPANSAFDVTIQTGSINTNHQQRGNR
jgi:polyisoprenoid-binding protein YceI